MKEGGVREYEEAPQRWVRKVWQRGQEKQLDWHHFDVKSGKEKKEAIAQMTKLSLMLPG